MAHYDYWSNKLKRSILLDSQADLLMYGMGERSIVEIAEALDSGLSVHDLTFIRGTVYKAASLDNVYDYTLLPPYQELLADKRAYAKSFAVQSRNTDPFSGKTLVEPYDERTFLVQNPPQEPLTQQEMDDTYDLPYQRTYHPMYEKDGGIDAIREVKFSLHKLPGLLWGHAASAP